MPSLIKRNIRSQNNKKKRRGEEEWKTLWRVVINERGENQETKSFSAAFAIRSHGRILDASSLRFPVFSSVEQYYSEEEKECLEKSNDQYLPARFSLLWKSATSDIILYIRPYFYAGGKLPVNTAARSIRHLRWKYLRSLPVHLSPPPSFSIIINSSGRGNRLKFNHGRKVSPREIFSQRISL